MAKFPVESDDNVGVIDALNYLLSGPTGLGQNFAGYSSYTPTYLTGNFRLPFTQAVYIFRSGSGYNGETTLNVYPNANNLVVGMSVFGNGIDVGSTIISIGETVVTPSTEFTPIVLSLPLIDDLDKTPISFLIPSPRGSLPPSLYVSPINCSSAVQIDYRTFQYNFATTQAYPPFNDGNNISGDGWANDFYNGNQGVIGVVKCTTDYVIFRTNNSYPNIGDDTGGGTVYYIPTMPMSTDCEARTTVTGGTDRVFISAQLDQSVNYTVPTGTEDVLVRMQINRYIGQLNNDPINPDYFFIFDGTVAEKVYSFTGLTGTGTLPLIETVFSSILDNPKPSLYRYILEVNFSNTNNIHITEDELRLRSISVQVVKQ